jgi:hypothetical protein
MVGYVSENFSYKTLKSYMIIQFEQKLEWT